MQGEAQIILPGRRVVLRGERGGIDSGRDSGELRGSLLEAPPSFQPPDRRQPPSSRTSGPSAFPVKHRFAAKGQCNIEVATYLEAVKTRRRHAENLEGMSIERELAANDVGTAAKFPLPKRVADHRSADAAPAIVVALCDQPAQHRLHLENLKEAAADPYPSGVARLATTSQVKPLRAPRGD